MAEVTYIGDPEGEGEDHKPKISIMGYDFKMGKAIIVNDLAHIKKFLGNRFFSVKQDDEDGGGTSDSSATGGESAPETGSVGSRGKRSAA